MMKMSEMRTEKLSSVKRVIYLTRELRSKTTMTIRIPVIQTPVQNRNARKSIPLSLHHKIEIKLYVVLLDRCWCYCIHMSIVIKDARCRLSPAIQFNGGNHNAGVVMMSH